MGRQTPPFSETCVEPEYFDLQDTVSLSENGSPTTKKGTSAPNAVGLKQFTRAVMTFNRLHIGEMFQITYDFSGVQVKIDRKTALNLLTGQLCPVNFNKKIEPPSSLSFDKSLFLAWQRGNPVIVRKTTGGFMLFHLLIIKSELCRDALEIQGIPYGATDEVDIILSKLQVNLAKCQSMTQTLATLREA